MLVVGDYPSRDDLAGGKAWTSPADRFLETRISAATGNQRLLEFRHVVMHADPGSEEDVKALRTSTEKLKPGLIIASGFLAQQAFGFRGAAHENNGQIGSYKGVPVLACIGATPAYYNKSKAWYVEVAMGQLQAYLGGAPKRWTSTELVGSGIAAFLQKRHPLAAIDLETRGVVREGGRILCVGVAIIGVKNPSEGFWFRWTDDLMPKLRKWMAVGVRIIQNCKYELDWLCETPQQAFEWQLYDTMLAEWCIRSEERLGLQHLMARYRLGVPYHWGDTDKSNLVMHPSIGNFCALDARACYEIAMQQMRNHPDRLELFARMGRLAATLHQIERTGTLIDPAATEKLKAETQEKLDGLQGKLREKYGLANVGSPKQVQKLLFGDLGLKVLEETEKGAPKTDQEVLERMKTRHPVIPLIMRARRLKAKISNVYDSWLRLQKEGYLHPDVKVGRVVTGRLSCTDPNLQNMEREDEDDPEAGPEWRLLRSRFGKKGSLLKADLKHFELRITAEISKCRALIDVFQKGQDPHQATATKAGLTRQKGKQINLAMCSGTSPTGLAYNWHFEEREARRLWSKWYEIYPEVKRYVDGCKSEAERTGYLENSLGRIRNFDFDDKGWKNQAANFRMQSLGADLLYILLIKVQEALNEAGLRSCQLVPVHDCLVFDVYPGEMTKVKAIVEQALKELPCTVPMVMDYSERKLNG